MGCRCDAAKKKWNHTFDPKGAFAFSVISQSALSFRENETEDFQPRDTKDSQTWIDDQRDSIYLS